MYIHKPNDPQCTENKKVWKNDDNEKEENDYKKEVLVGYVSIVVKKDTKLRIFI